VVGIEYCRIIHDDILFKKHVEDLIDSSYGTPRGGIAHAWERYRVEPKLIEGKAGQPNLVDVAQ
jgi:hypothetical protein